MPLQGRQLAWGASWLATASTGQDASRLRAHAKAATATATRRPAAYALLPPRRGRGWAAGWGHELAGRRVRAENRHRAAPGRYSAAAAEPHHTCEDAGSGGVDGGSGPVEAGSAPLAIRTSRRRGRGGAATGAVGEAEDKPENKQSADPRWRSTDLAISYAHLLVARAAAPPLAMGARSHGGARGKKEQRRRV